MELDSEDTRTETGRRHFFLQSGIAALLAVFNFGFLRAHPSTRRHNRICTVDTIAELQSLRGLQIGDIVQVLGYYKSGDGGGVENIPFEIKMIY